MYTIIGAQIFFGGGDLKTTLNVGKSEKIQKRYVEMQAGDVPHTYADISLIKSLTGFLPKVSIDQGLEEFLIWYKKYYKING